MPMKWIIIWSHCVYMYISSCSSACGSLARFGTVGNVTNSCQGSRFCEGVGISHRYAIAGIANCCNDHNCERARSDEDLRKKDPKCPVCNGEDTCLSVCIFDPMSFLSKNQSHFILQFILWKDISPNYVVVEYPTKYKFTQNEFGVKVLEGGLAGVVTRPLELSSVKLRSKSGMSDQKWTKVIVSGYLGIRCAS